jgi:threonine/homoserine/homoserine lactone efflux protein
MEIHFLLKGIAIGFAIAAPVGPIGALCVRRTLSDGRTAGLVCGLGAATADATYGAVAGFGLTSVSSFLIGQQAGLRLAGGLFLLYLGIRFITARPVRQVAETGKPNLVSGFASTFLLTLTNPLTILPFAAIFAGLGVVSAGRNYLASTLLVLGVFTGSALWWLMLTTAVSVSRSRLPQVVLLWANRIAGLVMVAFGVVAIAAVQG